VSATVFVVAIDGPGGAGKSTTARAVAARLGLSYLDTGALYRCVALRAVEQGLALDDGPRIAEIARHLEVRFAAGSERVTLGDRDVTTEIRTPEMSQAASKVSALPPVREALVELQRRSARAPGTVAEGRDMGTVIFPDARLKVFLDATVDERARWLICAGLAGPTPSRMSVRSSQKGTPATREGPWRRFAEHPTQWCWTRPTSRSRRWSIASSPRPARVGSVSDSNLLKFSLETDGGWLYAPSRCRGRRPISGGFWS
jgi:cytidylate kinase